MAAARVRLGYPCMTLVMSQKMRTVTQKSLEAMKDKSKAFEKILELSHNNLQVLDLTLDWNFQHQVHFFRIYSELFPHLSNAKLEALVGAEQALRFRNLEPFLQKIRSIGRKIVKYDIRVTFHPNEFACLGSPKQEVIDYALLDLAWQARMIDMFEQAAETEEEKSRFARHFKDSVLVLHGGGQYGDKQAALERWAKTYKSMPVYISRRLVIENDERNYSPMDLIPLSQQLKLPIVLDFFHQECFEQIHPDSPKCDWSAVLPKVLQIWEDRNMVPKFHVSQQSPGRRIGTHSDSLTRLPETVLALQDQGKAFDIMLECKEKEKVVLKMVAMYKERFAYIKDNPSRKSSVHNGDSCRVVEEHTSVEADDSKLGKRSTGRNPAPADASKQTRGKSAATTQKQSAVSTVPEKKLKGRS